MLSHSHCHQPPLINLLVCCELLQLAGKPHHNHSQGEEFENIVKISFFQDAAKPVTELPFPSVTICSPGLNMEAVKEALLDDFEHWLYENDKSLGNRREQLDVFMKKKYGTRVAGGNFFDRIKEINSPPSSSGQETRVLHNLATCAAAAKTDNEASISRRKRLDTGSTGALN